MNSFQAMLDALIATRFGEYAQHIPQANTNKEPYIMDILNTPDPLTVDYDKYSRVDQRHVPLTGEKYYVVFDLVKKHLDNREFAYRVYTTEFMNELVARGDINSDHVVYLGTNTYTAS